jgi:hypothetical protein
MQSVEGALGFDYWRKGRGGLLLATMGMTAVPLYVYRMLGHAGTIDPELPPAVTLHVVFTLVMGFCAGTTALIPSAPLLRHFSYPISAARLVLCQLLFVMLSVAAIYLIAGSVLNLSGARWPLVGPALFLATASACALVAIWSFEGSQFGQLAASCGVLVPLGIWFSRCYGSRVFGDWNRMWREPSASELLTLAGLCLAAYCVGVVNVTRTRRGDFITFSSLRTLWERAVNVSRRTPQRLASPFAAQLWMEWNQNLGVAPAIGTALLGLLLLTLRLTGRLDSTGLLELMFLLTLGLQVYVMPLVFGLILGNRRGNRPSQDMAYWLATRPISDALHARAILSNCGFVVLSAWLVWLAFVALAAGVVYLTGDGQAITRALQSPQGGWRAMVVVALLGPASAWALLAGITALVATGRSRLAITVLMTGFGLLVGYIVLCTNLPQHVVGRMNHIAGILAGLAIVLMTLATYTLALRRRLMSKPLAAVAGIAALAGAAILIAVWPEQSRRDPLLFWSFGCLALFLFPLAAMPVAIHWNRHR